MKDTIPHNNKLLYITGSFPDSREGIADCAKVTLDAMSCMTNPNNIILLTTNVSIISKNIKHNSPVTFFLMDDWKVKIRNIKKICNIVKNNKITKIHMEYPGDLYGKTLLASVLPLIIKFYNVCIGTKVIFSVRLHEFTHARLLRRIAIVPILLFADNIYIPALHDRETAQKIAGKKIKPTIIGSNIKVVETAKENKNIPVVSYFGSVYQGKGIERTICLWEKIKEKYKQPIRFKFIGDIGTEETNHFSEYHKYIWSVIRQSSIQKEIIVTGYVSDEQASIEITNSDVATVLYEDGLTLRRGSFIAYLSHGIPIITSMPDLEAAKLLGSSEGIYMSDNLDDMAEKVVQWLSLSEKDRIRIMNDNRQRAKHFSWEEIAKKFLTDYEMELI